MEGRGEGFHVIWVYWAKKYMKTLIKGNEALSPLIKELQRHYCLEAIESSALLAARLAAIRHQKGSQKWPIFVVDPEKEAAGMQAALGEGGMGEEAVG